MIKSTYLLKGDTEQAGPTRRLQHPGVAGGAHPTSEVDTLGAGGKERATVAVGRHVARVLQHHWQQRY